MTRKKATIYDLAERSGASPSTVSAVLNGSWTKRRIASETAQRVLSLANELQYTVNRQARGLRRSRSGLIGMIVPMHDNRFFSAMSQTFEKLARERHLCPMVVGTLRDPALEVDTARTLISYQVESLVVTGATDPDGVSMLCARHGVGHVNVDLPGALAPSVISDNHRGALELTTRLIARSAERPQPARNRMHFIGGVASDFATQRRMEAFSQAVIAAFGSIAPDQIDPCGYEPERAEAAVRALHARLGGLPRGLFVNSTIALEGVVRFLKTLPRHEVDACAIGSYDWDPFAASLGFAPLMVRQDIDRLMHETFKIFDSGVFVPGQVIQVPPMLIETG